MDTFYIAERKLCWNFLWRQNSSNVLDCEKPLFRWNYWWRTKRECVQNSYWAEPLTTVNFGWACLRCFKVDYPSQTRGTADWRLALCRIHDCDLQCVLMAFSAALWLIHDCRGNKENKIRHSGQEKGQRWISICQVQTTTVHYKKWGLLAFYPIYWRMSITHCLITNFFPHTGPARSNQIKLNQSKPRDKFASWHNLVSNPKGLVTWTHSCQMGKTYVTSGCVYWEKFVHVRKHC